MLNPVGETNPSLSQLDFFLKNISTHLHMSPLLYLWRRGTARLPGGPSSSGSGAESPGSRTDQRAEPGGCVLGCPQRSAPGASSWSAHSHCREGVQWAVSVGGDSYRGPMQERAKKAGMYSIMEGRTSLSYMSYIKENPFDTGWSVNVHEFLRLWKRSGNWKVCCHPPLCDAFNVSPAAELRLLGHRIGQLPPSAGWVVQHLWQPVQDFFTQSTKAHFPFLHLRVCHH